MKFLNYIRPTWEGPDGRASMKRLTIFLFVVLFVIAFFGDFVLDWYVSDTILNLIATIIISGVLGNQAQNIVNDFLDKNKKNEEG